MEMLNEYQVAFHALHTIFPDDQDLCPLEHSLASVLAASPCYCQDPDPGKSRDEKQKTFYFCCIIKYPGNPRFKLVEFLNGSGRKFKSRSAKIVSGRLYCGNAMITIDFEKILGGWKQSLQAHVAPDLIPLIIQYLADFNLFKEYPRSK